MDDFAKLRRENLIRRGLLSDKDVFKKTNNERTQKNSENYGTNVSAKIRESLIRRGILKEDDNHDNEQEIKSPVDLYEEEFNISNKKLENNTFKHLEKNYENNVLKINKEIKCPNESLAKIRQDNLLRRGLLTEDQLIKKNEKVQKIGHEEGEMMARSLTMHKQIQDVRSVMHNRFLSARKNDFSKSFMEKLREDSLEKDRFLLEASKQNPNASSFSTRIGRDSLRLTNEYRKKMNLPAIIWSQEIHNISVEHSQQMAEKKKGFDHSGFNARVSKIPFPISSSGENLFMITELSEKAIAEQAVDGWIHSPPHQKNLVGNFNLCGIGAYKSEDGMVYITQIFALG